MRDVLERLDDEIGKARFRKDTMLVSRLHEAKREIEYLRRIYEWISALEDKYLPRSFRRFVDMMRQGQKITKFHPILRPDEAMELAERIMERRQKTDNVEVRGATQLYRGASPRLPG